MIIKQMREQSGAHIKVLSPEELPACALSNDRVVQCVSTPCHGILVVTDSPILETSLNVC